MSPLRDASGNVVRWYNLLIDIDDQKRAEDAIRESERNLQLIDLGFGVPDTTRADAGCVRAGVLRAEKPRAFRRTREPR